MVYCTQYPSPAGAVENIAAFAPARAWLDAYFRGQRREVDFPIRMEGTAFQQRVWDILKTIPYGEAVTYGAIARQLGEKMSAQAVGGAVGRNPVSIIVPCHRVLGTGGRLTGYAFGLDKKKWLLGHENIPYKEEGT